MKKLIERKVREQLEREGYRVMSLVTHRIPGTLQIDFINETAADAVTKYSDFEMKSRMNEYETRGIRTVYLTDALLSGDNGLGQRYFINGIRANPFLADEIRVANLRRIAEEDRYGLRRKYLSYLAYLINHIATRQESS